MCCGKPDQRALIGLAVAWAALILWWYEMDVRAFLPFWSEPSDYVVLALGHALNMDQWLREHGHRTVAYFETFHPGLPFQVLSWLAYRVAAPFAPPPPPELLRQVLADPDPFWRAANGAALMLVLGGCGALWMAARRLGALAPATALGLFFLCAASLQYGATLLCNDGFALPMAALFLMAAKAAFAEEGQESRLRWVLLGFVAALAYANKLNYLMWGVSVPAGLAVSLIAGTKWRRVLGQGALFLAGFGIALLTVFLPLLRWGGLKRLFGDHLKVLLNTGYYGEGMPGIISAPAFLGNARALFDEAPFFCAAIGLVVLAILRGRGDEKWMRHHAPVGAMLALAVVLGLVAALKHYHLHYMLPVAAIMAMAYLWLAAASGWRHLSGLVCVPVMVGVALTAWQAWTDRLQMVDNATATQAAVARVRALPLAEGQIRAWAYPIIAPEFRAYFAVQTSAIKRYFPIVEARFPQDREFNVWKGMVRAGEVLVPLETVPWRYIVFTPENVPASLSGRPDVRLLELGRLTVVEHLEPR